MPSFTMQELMTSVNDQETVYKPSHSETIRSGIARVGEMKHRSLEDTRTLIKSVLKEANRPMLRKEICVAMNRKNSPHMVKIMDDMVDAGELVKAADGAPNGIMPRYWYSLP